MKKISIALAIVACCLSILAFDREDDVVLEPILVESNIKLLKRDVAEIREDMEKLQSMMSGLERSLEQEGNRAKIEPDRNMENQQEKSIADINSRLLQLELELEQSVTSMPPLEIEEQRLSEFARSRMAEEAAEKYLAAFWESEDDPRRMSAALRRYLMLPSAARKADAKVVGKVVDIISEMPPRKGADSLIERMDGVTDTRLIQPLLGVLSSAAWGDSARSDAASVLRSFSNRSDVKQALQEALNSDQSPKVRRAAARALKGLDTN